MFHFAHTQTPLRQLITQAYRQDESLAVQDILSQAKLNVDLEKQIQSLARKLVVQVRQDRSKASGVDALMHEFTLSSEEGIALMCLAEALLRIPDKTTQDQLIRDKLATGNWKSHLNHSPSLFVNAASWGLLITGKLTASYQEEGLAASLTRILAKGGEPLIRRGVDYAMRILGKQFVTGQTIQEALANGKEREKRGYRFSFDMLGEAAMTHEDALRYFNDYLQAIHAIGQDAKQAGVYEGNGISVKLSAIHPRYSRAQHTRVMDELYPRLKELFVLAKQYDIGLNIDAEEADRLELSLDLIEKLAQDKDLAGFNGIGIVVQAYQKRCPFVIDYLIDLAKRTHHRFMVRLVKGAYWDAEIKRAQVDGLEGYPVYTRKVYTDVSYIACAKKLLFAQAEIFPQFATHNAYTLAAVYHLAQGKDFEFQCLHGMGETLYDQVVGSENLDKRCRIYAPVGTHETLLAYLVRRLLENGANSSFVNRIVDEQVSIDELIESPIEEASKYGGQSHSKLPLPRNLYGSKRANSRGMDLSNEIQLALLQTQLNEAIEQKYQASSLIADVEEDIQQWQNVHNPANHEDIVGQVAFLMDHQLVIQAVEKAKQFQSEWADTVPEHRAKVIRQFADLLENNMAVIMMLAVREAGKTFSNAVAEVREAVDFCRYYANQVEESFNNDTHQPLGVVVAISPWNFPLAIFVGEVVSSLAAGNAVLAKPAEQTSLIAHFAINLLHQAGVPKAAVQLLLGTGEIVGEALTSCPLVDGVIFTGSTSVAKSINHNLAKRSEQPVLIAETGGQNAMIVDSSALPEQVVIDVLQSAFDSAGQRCSALRVLFIQEDIADKLLHMIKGAMNELVVGNPSLFNTDVGPVIDQEAQENLLNHIKQMKLYAKAYHQIELPQYAHQGTYIAPILFELSDLSELTKEVFGPVLHVVRYQASNLDNVLEQINQTGFALTHGVHSRINQTIDTICRKVEAGNIYINRNIVGAVVGVQPFGGHGLSGTGPKAGGVFYLQRLTKLKQWALSNQFSDVSTLNEIPQLTQLLAHCDDYSFLSMESKEILKQEVHCFNQNLLLTTLKLVGPTGEDNLLKLRSRNNILIYGQADIATSLKVFIAVLAAGSCVWVDSQSELASFAHYFPNWVKIFHDPLDNPAYFWLTVKDVPVEVKLAVAKRKGPITLIVDATEEVNFLQLFDETSISINTTAAGGNASLMAMAE
ncbi:bifunctional proline dehydrogenase/L-glutamate gamma-semialdehyde dehydrogenase PutA [Neisseria sp. Ec49-e6-T10]|uniref:bifunctional proline dehydrogenase/L-glutamate gamma-semialdehyde dehydrogenase PutA n=1 Tax=Neisseria sp. Ec49-e6-T10 TaxID=3140744 RepID=UPI003EB85126